MKPPIAQPVDIDQGRDYPYEIHCWQLATGFLLAMLLFVTVFWCITARQLTHAMIILEKHR